MTTENDGTRHVLLLGASVGKAWNISALPERTGSFGYTFEFIGEYSFDKSKKLGEILGRTQNRPEVIIIKECATYFPGDLDRYRRLVKEWVDSCRRKHVAPVLATTVPVLRTYPLRMFLYNLLHGKIGFPSGTYEGVIEFNDWIREYAGKEGLSVLDLESAVRISASNRHLKAEFARRDGLHLNEKAYEELDKIVIPTLEKVGH